MADRGPIVPTTSDRRRAPRRSTRGDRTTVVVKRPGSGGGVGDPPTGPFGTPSPHDPTPSLNNRLATPGSQRELTVHPAEGVVEEQFGGPLKRGGKVIYFRNFASFVVADLSLGEGAYATIDTLRWQDKTAAQLGIVTEVHLGTAGDTGSSIIEFYEPGYTQPDNLARVVISCPKPTQASGIYNPFDFTCMATRADVDDGVTGFTGSSGNPIAAAYSAAAHTIDPATELVVSDWIAEQAECDVDVGGGIKQWEFALLLDTQDQLDNQLKVILSYCFAHLRYNDGKYGVYAERLADPAQYSDGVGLRNILFDDNSPTENNTSGEITFVQKGAQEVPSVVIIHYTDKLVAAGITTFIDASVQVPAPADYDPAIPWIPLELVMAGFTTIEMSRRYGTRRFNLSQKDKDITIPCWQSAMLPIVGERVQLNSRLLLGVAEVNGNAGAVAGVDDATVTDIKIGDSSIMRAELYREASFGEVVDADGPPDPPNPPPDPDADPDCPNDLVAPHADVSEYGMIEFTPPADDSIISYYAVYDIWSGSPVYVGNVDHLEPLGGDGKYHKSFPALVHTDVSGVHLAVRVKSVSFAFNFCSPGPETSWDEGGASSTAGDLITMVTVVDPGASQTIPTNAYGWQNYVRIEGYIAPPTATTFVDPNKDFMVLGGNPVGVIVPLADGFYHVTVDATWDAIADSTFRALSLFRLFPTNGTTTGIHALSFTIDAPGTSYTSGQVISGSGGAGTANRIQPVGVIVAAGGLVTGLSWTAGTGVGFTSVPTMAIAGGGSGATITAHLPATFVIADLNIDCGVVGTPKGAFVKEVTDTALNSTDIFKRQDLSFTMPLKRGAGLIAAIQHGSAGDIDFFDSNISLFRVWNTPVAADVFAECPPPE